MNTEKNSIDSFIAIQTLDWSHCFSILKPGAYLVALSNYLQKLITPINGKSLILPTLQPEKHSIFRAVEWARGEEEPHAPFQFHA